VSIMELNKFNLLLSLVKAIMSYKYFTPTGFCSAVSDVL
jgi:hypothetical protein